MDEKTTQVRDEDTLMKNCKNKRKPEGVSSGTLDFLRMFARSYDAESSQPVTQPVVCMN